jgi:DNA-binding transcriptional LysR family regulator
MVSLDIDLLRVFVAIAEETSFTGAGQRLYRTQSTVSLQLKRLEQQLDKRLVQRVQGRVLGLTDAGETLLDHARRIIRANDEAAVALDSPKLAGIVHLGVPDESVHSVISRALAAFRSRYPLVRLEVTCRLSTELDDLINRGRLDLALINRCDPVAVLPDRLYTERLMWVASNSLSWRSSQPIPLAGFPPGCAYRARTISALEGAGLDWVDVYTSTSHYGVWAAVTSGLGLAALPTVAVPRQASGTTYQPELPELGDVEVALVCDPARETETVRCLCDHIRTQLSDRGHRRVFEDWSGPHFDRTPG